MMERATAQSESDFLTRFRMIDSLDSMEGIARLERTAPRGVLNAHRLGRLLFAIYPGALTAIVMGLAAAWLSQHYGAPVMLFALLIGMAFHFLHEEGRCVAGIEFASRQVLRVGVALLGARITVEQVASLGVVPVATVIVSVATTIAIGVVFADRLRLSRLFGVLSGGAVAICGASAALAIASVLPQRRDSERDTVLVVVAVTGLSTLAMILYPIFVTGIGLDHIRAGLFLGGTIHDVAQVVGAGYMISPQTGDIATYVKLLRVAMLAPAVLGITIAMARTRKGDARAKTPILPAFLIGFILLAAINSAGWLSPAMVGAATDASRWCLVTAIAALGMKTSLRDLAKVGWRPIGLMVVETAWIAGLVFLSVHYLAP
jgi:uncharacterized integral membrane protein (TIGR00698 family)